MHGRTTIQTKRQHEIDRLWQAAEAVLAEFPVNEAETLKGRFVSILDDDRMTTQTIGDFATILNIVHAKLNRRS